MDTKYIESLVPMSCRPYLKEYLRLERVEADKELLAVVLPLIPYDERADLIFESFINVNSSETAVIQKFMQDKAYIIEQINLVLKIDARLDDISIFLDKFVSVFKNNKDNLAILINRGIELSSSVPSIVPEYEEDQSNLNKLTRFYEDEVMSTYLEYLRLYKAIGE